MNANAPRAEYNTAKYDLLVLDDDDIALERFRRYFRKHPEVRCFVTNDVSDAIWVLQHSGVKTALIDFRMPETNGLIFIRQLALERLPFPTEFIINSSSHLTQTEKDLAEQFNVEIMDKAKALTQTGLDEVHRRLLRN